MYIKKTDIWFRIQKKKKKPWIYQKIKNKNKKKPTLWDMIPLTKRKKTKSAKSCTIKDNEKKNPLQRGGFVCPSGVYIVVGHTPRWGGIRAAPTACSHNLDPG